MKMDRKANAEHNPARLKTNHSKSVGKKTDRIFARANTAKGQLPGFEEGTPPAQEESIGSQQRLLATYEHAPIGIIENSPEGNYVNCNEEFCRITGYEKEELLTLAIKDLTYEDDYIFDIKLHQRLVAGEIPFYKLEKRYVRKDGRLIWAEVTRSLVRDADGKPLYTIGVVLDVSERKRAEQALTEFARQQEALFKLADQLHRTNALEDAFNAALDAILSALQCDRASILLFDEMGEMRFVAWRGLSDDYRKATDGHSPWKTDEKNPEPICIDDIRVAELSDSLKAVIQGEGIGSLAFVPLVSNGKIVGKFMAYFNAPHVFSDAELDLSLTIARQLAFGIERKRAEEALRASEALYRTIARSIPGGGIYVVDKDFRYLVAEGPVTEAFGLSRELLEGRTVSEIFPTEAGERMKERLQRNYAGETISYETKHNGRVYWTQQAPLLDSNKQAVVVTLDVTSQKQAEEALRGSKERYQNLFDLVPIAVYTCDADGLIQEFNHRAVELWGREPLKNDPNERFCGSFKIFYPDGRFMPHEKCPMARMLAGETLEPHELEILVERPDGVRRNVLSHPLALKNERAEIIGAINCLYDISERKQAEEALQQLNLQLESRVQSRTQRLNEVIEVLREEISERKRAEGQLVYQAQLIANVNDAIIATDENLAISYWNQAAEQIYGWKPEEVMGRSATEVLQSEFMDGKTRSEPLQKVKETGELRTAVTHLRKDGTRIFIDAHTSILQNESGKTVGYISINHDVTERTQAEEALHKSRESLRKLSKRLVEVQEDERRAIARELHDRVGQTLAALNINLMIMNGQLLEDSKQRIGSRLDDSMHLVAEAIALVRNVMTDLRPAVLDDYGLEAALQSYIEGYQSRYDIKVLLDPADQPLPRLGPSVEMTLLRIAQEALTNVARHAQARQVHVSLQLADHSVYLTVQDDGVGIESWQRANQPGSHGMRIMRERAEAFGGILNVGSTPGNGTKVEARIPIASGGQNKVQEEKG